MVKIAALHLIQSGGGKIKKLGAGNADKIMGADAFFMNLPDQFFLEQGRLPTRDDDDMHLRARGGGARHGAAATQYLVIGMRRDDGDPACVERR